MIEPLRCTQCERQAPFVYVIDVLVDESVETIEVCGACLVACTYPILSPLTGEVISLPLDEEWN